MLDAVSATLISCSTCQLLVACRAVLQLALPCSSHRPVFDSASCRHQAWTDINSWCVLMTPAGTVRYAYHRFGPLNPNAAVQRPRLGTELERAQSNPTPNSPVVFISGWGFSMYIWPIPVSAGTCLFCKTPFLQQHTLTQPSLSAAAGHAVDVSPHSLLCMLCCMCSCCNDLQKHVRW